MAGPKRFFWLILAPGSAQDPTCWDGVFTKDLCCDKRYGPKGNEGCWDPVHTFERCCGVEEDCRVSEEFNPEKCCDLVKSDRGDEACWSGAQTFEHCCGGNRTPRVTGDRPLEKLPTFGEGCWDAERLVTFGRCCGGTAFEDVCWTGDFSYDRCCIGLGPIQRYFMDLPKEHDMVRCVREGLEGPSKAKANITYEECSGKYLYVSAVSYRYAEVVAMHDFWWQRPQDEKMDRIGPEVTAPEWLSHAGEVCVPKICSEAAVAGWFASMVDIGQFYIQPSYRELNDSHVRVSPLTARERPYPSFRGSWLTFRPQADALLRKEQNIQQYFEFVLTEKLSLRQLELSAKTQGVLLALTLPTILATLLSLGLEVVRPLALQTSWKALGAPRQRYFDLFRVVITSFVIAQHVKDHYLFPKDHTSSPFGYMLSTVEAFPENALVVLLMVFLVLRRLDTHPPAVHGIFSWLGHLISYALRRWALILSVVGIWLYIYLAVIIEEIPLPNIGKSRFLYIWFWRHRLSCAQSKHWIPTIFLAHEVLHAKPTPCHNINIFEAIFQIDVLLTAVLVLLPRRLSALLSALTFIPLARCGSVPDDGPPARSIDYLPVGLLTVAIANGLPKAATLAQWRWPIRWILWLLAVASYGCFGLLTAETEADLQVRRLGRDLGVPIWVLREVPALLGTVLVLRLLDAQASPLGHGWSPLSALGRLCGQINITHLFVLQIHRGFATGMDGITTDDIFLPPSPSLFLWLWAGLFVCSVGVATILFLFMEGPVQALLGRRDGGRGAVNGTSNGHVVNGHRR